MADSKKKNEPKHKPRGGEVWEDTAKHPVPVYHLKTYYQRGNSNKERGFTCEIIEEDGRGNQNTRTGDVPLLKFGEPGMQMVDDSKAQDEESAGGGHVGQPAVMVKPIKNGIALMCPGQGCGDKHEFTFQVSSFEDLVKEMRAAHAKFLHRHGPHMSDGSLYGGVQS